MVDVALDLVTDFFNEPAKGEVLPFYKVLF